MISVDQEFGRGWAGWPWLEASHKAAAVEADQASLLLWLQPPFYLASLWDLLCASSHHGRLKAVLAPDRVASGFRMSVPAREAEVTSLFLT